MILQEALTPEQLVNLTPDKVERAYSGKPGCMCGCKGKYYEAGHKQITRILNILKTDPRVRLMDGYILHIDEFDAGDRNYVCYLKRPVQL